MVHFIFIPLIVLMLWMVYGAFFRNWAKKHYESGFRPGPKDLHAYTREYQVEVILALLFVIIIYVLIITGVLKK